MTEFLGKVLKMKMLALRSGDLCLDVAPDVGGSIAGFYIAQKNGRFDLMRPAAPNGTTKPAALSMSMFPMVPFANCIRDNTFALDGKNYSVTPNIEGNRLNFHGSGWLHPWIVQEHCPNHAVLTLECSDGPYSFTATQEFHLSDKALKVATSLTNNASNRMPFGMGQHPWFPRHGEVRVRFQSGSYLTCDEDGQTIHKENSEQDFDFSQWREPQRVYQNRCYQDWAGLAEIYWPGAAVHLAISGGTVFKYLMFHVPASDPETFCLEPQTNTPCGFDTLDQFEIGPGIYLLKTDETLSGKIEFSISSFRNRSSKSMQNKVTAKTRNWSL